LECDRDDDGGSESDPCAYSMSVRIETVGAEGTFERSLSDWFVTLKLSMTIEAATRRVTTSRG